MKKRRCASILNVILIAIVIVTTGLTNVPLAYLGAQPASAESLTAAAEATPTPASPQGPIVIDQKPVAGEEQPPDAPLTITFDQAMNQASVQAALTISPTVAGKVEWSGNTLSFTPGPQGFVRATTYHVTLTDAAKSASGQPLLTPLDYRFQTVGYLEVAEVLPAPDSTEVDFDTTVTVIFNRPVVPLTSLGQQGSLPQVLTFQPAVRGTGEWLNTSIYSFKATGGFTPATLYKARIAAGLKDTMGSILKDDYVWEFTTKLPAVDVTAPVDNAPYVGPSSPIVVTFNQPMNHKSVEDSFSLENQRTGEMITGSFSWLTGQMTVTTPAGENAQGEPQPTAINGDQMTFVPAQRLELATTYTAKVAMGAKAASGAEGLPVDYVWTFTTISLPAVSKTDPKNGDRQADLGSFSIDFTSPMSTDVFGTEPDHSASADVRLHVLVEPGHPRAVVVGS